MADISKEIEAWRSARYGKDVRQAQIDLSNKLNTEVEQGTQTIHNYTAAEAARVEAEAARAQAEVERVEEFDQMMEDAETAIEDVRGATIAASDYITQQGQRAEAAANQAEAAVADLAQRVENGEFNGPPGPVGPPGEDGKDGADGVIMTLTAGQIAMQIQDGDLHVYYSDADDPPGYSIQDGDLILNIEEGGE